MALKIGLISDTHGVLRPDVVEILGGCDHILHAGDVDRLEILEALRDIAPLQLVRGNNDWGRWAEALPRRLQFTLGGVSFFMTHNRMDVPAKLPGVQVVVFGHSHQYLQQEFDGRLWLNPGSCGWPRFGNGLTMALLYIEDQRLRVEQVTLES